MEVNLSQSLDTHALLAAASVAAEEFGFAGFVTNSIFVAAFVTLAILWFTRMATKKMALVPDQKQNFVEFVVEFLYSQTEEIVGKKVTPRIFPLLATLFIFILVSNWFGLIPGVGTIGFGETTGWLTLDPHGHFVPLLRPATADVNMTLGMAAVFMIVWAWITISEVGVWGFLVHTFGPKGGLTGFLKWVLVPIFLFVGVIEIISIALRPVSLSLRLFGNVFAGENLLHTMSHMGENWGMIGSFMASVILPLPFYFLEILVGILQAIVFALLCAVYVQLSATHDEEEEEH